MCMFLKMRVHFPNIVQSVAIHPHFSRSTNRVFVLGNAKVKCQMYVSCGHVRTCVVYINIHMYMYTKYNVCI